MNKWEYAYLSVGEDGLFIEPSRHFDEYGGEAILDWIKNQFPKIARGWPQVTERGGGYSIDHLKKQDYQVGSAFLDLLGSQGWEAYAVTQTEFHLQYHLKRPLPQGDDRE